MTRLLDITGLEVSYGTSQALRGIDLHVDEGECVALVGPNGAGKTSLMNAIAGLVKPVSGAITFEGKDLRSVPTEAIARTGVSLVPEGRGLFGGLTVEENLRLGTTARKDKASVAAHFETIYGRFPVLQRKRRTRSSLLSGGEQQMLAIARALLATPRILLLDEPSLGLAPLIVDDVFALVAELREAGTTVLLVEQNATRAIDLADRSYILRTGNIVMSGTREELAERDIAGDYLGDAQ